MPKHALQTLVLVPYRKQSKPQQLKFSCSRIIEKNFKNITPKVIHLSCIYIQYWIHPFIVPQHIKCSTILLLGYAPIWLDVITWNSETSIFKIKIGSSVSMHCMAKSIMHSCAAIVPSQVFHISSCCPFFFFPFFTSSNQVFESFEPSLDKRHLHQTF